MRNIIAIIFMKILLVLKLEAQVKEIPLTVTNIKPQPVYVKFSPNSKRILFYGKALAPTCYVKDLATGYTITPRYAIHDLYNTSAADFHPSGDYIVFAAVEVLKPPPYNNPDVRETTCVWSLTENGCEASLSGKESNENSIIDAKFNKIGTHLLIIRGVGNGINRELWDWMEGGKTRILAGNDVGFSYEGDYLWAESYDDFDILNTDGTWSKKIKRNSSDGDFPWAATIACDNNKLVIGTYYGNIEIWDIKSGQMVKKSKIQTKSIEPLLFDKICRRFLTISDNILVKIWDFETLELQTTLKGHHTRALTEAQFSPNGYYLVTGSKDSTACIWDSRTGERLALLGKYKGSVNTTQFSVTGDTVLVSDDYGEAHMYDVSGLHPSTLENELYESTDNVVNITFNHSGLQLYLNKPSGTPIEYSIINYVGEKIQQGIIMSGNTLYEVPTQGLQSGMYFFTTEINGKRVQEKFAIMR